MKTDRFQFERELLNRGVRWVAGVDEAGRGPLAGPVVAAAVVLPDAWVRGGMPEEWEGLNDSKQLSERRREFFYEAITRCDEVRWSIRSKDSGVIDAVNILAATHLAMNEAVAALGEAVAHVLVDGLRVASLRWPQTPLVKGDSRSYSIAAASVLAKVTRDRWMMEADRQWPGYGFSKHKGYPTADHLKALAQLGPSPIHRRSFAPVRPPEPELFPR